MLNKIAECTDVEIDDELIESERQFLLDSAKQNALGRGQTWQEFLDSLAQSEDHYLNELKKVAITRIKGGLAIGEIASNEGLSISDSELETEIANLKTRYSDPEMLEQLDSPNNRSELRMRLLTEKVLDFILKSQS
jgi:FKBP-type peptidyl-prolyl cis-trans isomerase (trigger factor)